MEHGTTIPVPLSESTTESVLYHYVVIRKDLPVGVALAQCVHAAGESAANLEVPPNTHAVVLSVENEAELLRLESKLLANGISIFAIREPDEPWSGALMAIGLPPQPRTKSLKKLFSNLKLYK